MTFNILVLGEVGVGKSTFINGFANCLKYKTLEEAIKNEYLCLSPFQFILCDSNHNPVKIGNKNKLLEPTSFIFKNDKYNINFIDTPGFGVELEQDTDNMNKILQMISQYPKIDSICILIKSNSCRSNILFKFILSETLSKFKDKSSNILFCFTNVASTFYAPGDSIIMLKKLLEELNISFDKNKIYSFDNEGLRLLYCLHANVIFKKQDYKLFKNSWNHSHKEYLRLVNSL